MLFPMYSIVTLFLLLIIAIAFHFFRCLHIYVQCFEIFSTFSFFLRLAPPFVAKLSPSICFPFFSLSLSLNLITSNRIRLQARISYYFFIGYKISCRHEMNVWLEFFHIFPSSFESEIHIYLKGFSFESNRFPFFMTGKQKKSPPKKCLAIDELRYIFFCIQNMRSRIKN